MFNDILSWLIIIGSILLLWYCPIFKPNFGWTCKWKDLGK